MLIVKLTFVNKTVGRSTITTATIPAASISTLKSEPQHPVKARLLLAVPNLVGSANQLSAERKSNSEQATHSKPLSATGRIPLSPAESTLFQEGVRRLKLSFLCVVGGSLFWRLFLGSSVAVFIGATTLACMNPTSPTAPSNSRSAGPITASNSEPSQPIPSTVEQPKIELTVSTSDINSGQEPAQYDDPFVPENQVQPKYLYALHLATQNESQEAGVIRQVSRRRSLSSRPASLHGSIETNEESTQLPSLTPLRNHERSRPRDR